MARKTKEDALATRDRMLDTAELLFHAQGVSRTSLHDIAHAAGVTRGAIYWHFKDKADLFNAMMERVCCRWKRRVVARRPRATPSRWRACAPTLVQVAASWIEDDPRTRRVFEIATHKVEYVDELDAVRERRLRGRREHVEKLERLLRSAQQQGSVAGGISARTPRSGCMRWSTG